MPPAPDPGLARLAAAVLMPGFRGARLPDWLARATEAGLGGVCLFAPNVGAGLPALTAAVHGIRSDVLVASDEEGGEVTRLEAATGSSWPGHAALGRVDDLDATTRIAAAIGAQSRRAGVDLVLAPDADVTSNPDNPVIGLRSFGTDPGLVARHTAAFVAGLQGSGVAACAKHFPGHGDTRTDSHLGLPVIDVDVATLRRRDLPPFTAAVAAGVRAVMTAHVVVPALDVAPATLSPTVLGLLRGDLGFDGVIVSDAVDMRAISAGVGRGPGAALALAAGVDLVCIGNPSHPVAYDDEAAYREVHHAVLDAVAAGELSVARLEEAQRRVAGLAAWVRSRDGTPGSAGAPAGAGAGRTAAADPAGGAAYRLALEVARRALESHGSTRLAAPGALHVVDLRGAPTMAAGSRPSGVVTALRARRPGLTLHEVAGAGGFAIEPALLAADGSPLVAVTSSPHRFPEVAALLGRLLESRPDAVVVSTGLPDARDRLGEHWVRTWGDSLPAGEAAAEALLG